MSIVLICIFFEHEKTPVNLLNDLFNSCDKPVFCISCSTANNKSILDITKQIQSLYHKSFI